MDIALSNPNTSFTPSPRPSGDRYREKDKKKRPHWLPSILPLLAVASLTRRTLRLISPCTRTYQSAIPPHTTLSRPQEASALPKFASVSDLSQKTLSALKRVSTDLTSASVRMLSPWCFSEKVYC